MEYFFALHNKLSNKILIPDMLFDIHVCVKR